MADNKEREVLEIGLDVKEAMAEMSRWQRESSRHIEQIAKAAEKMGDVVKGVNKESTDSTEEWKRGVQDITKAYKQETAEIDRLGATLKEMRRDFDSLTDEQKEQNSVLKEQIELMQEARKEKMAALKIKGGNFRMYKQEAQEAKEAFRDVFKDVWRKDFNSAIAGVPKALAKGFKFLPSAGLRMQERGAGMAGRGNERGGARGAGMELLGGAMKGFGKILSYLKPVVETLSKVGPLLGAAAGAVVGLVKLFLDLDAKAKAFNKDILQSASSAEMLAAAGGNAEVAFEDVKGTLRGLRDAAHSLDNLDWGISTDEHKAIVNVLTQEGVTLRRIGNEAAVAGKDIESFATELAHVSVAYSRAFGVPLQEINTLQAELMTEMGANLMETKIAFQQMTRSAEDSGIASNKFFGIIRSVSQDLSLWSTRMEDAVLMLGRLGKVMNPRNAAKFMQTATQGLKNMGRTERLRLTLLTGQGKMNKLVERDINRKAKGLADKFGLSAEELVSKLGSAQGKAELEQKVRGMDPSQQGAMREALIDAQLQVDRKKKGVFGVSGAARTMGPAAALEAMQGALVKFGGGKKLSDIVGTIGGEMMADNLGVSEEQLDQMVKFEQSMDTQREVLKQQLASGNDDQMTAARDALKRAGVTAKNDEDLRKQIDSAGYDQIMDTLSADDKKLLEESAKVEDWAKKQADLQTSMVDKLGMIVEFLMNELYNIMIDIWDTIASIPGIGKSKEARDLQKEIYKGRDKDMAALFEKTKGDWVGFREELIKGGMGSKVSQTIEKGRQAGASVDDAANLQLLLKKIDLGIQHAGGSGAAQQAMNAAGITDKKQVQAVLGRMGQGESFSGAMTSAGLSEDKRAEALKKSLWFMDPKWLMQMGGKAPSAQAGGMGAGAPAAKAAAAQNTTNQQSTEDLKMTKEQTATLNSIDNQMDKFKMDTGFLNGGYSKAVEGSVLAAVRTALFEYYMYKDLDQQQVVEGALAAGSARSFAQQYSNMSTLQPNAAGGVVTGVGGGLATVTAAAGEGLASVGRGERIVPSGGGGSGGIHLHVNGLGGADLANFLRGKMNEAIYEYKRREKFS